MLRLLACGRSGGSGCRLLRLKTATDQTDGADALLEAAAGRGIPMVLCTPGDPRLRALYGARFALIRPDQHVAWRGDEILAPDVLLSRVTGFG